MGGDPFYPFSKLVYSIDIVVIIAISVFSYLRWGKKASLITISALVAVLVPLLNNQVIHRIIRGYSDRFSIIECFMLFLISLGIAGIVFLVLEAIMKNKVIGLTWELFWVLGIILLLAAAFDVTAVSDNTMIFLALACFVVSGVIKRITKAGGCCK